MSAFCGRERRKYYRRNTMRHAQISYSRSSSFITPPMWSVLFFALRGRVHRTQRHRGRSGRGRSGTAEAMRTADSAAPSAGEWLWLYLVVPLKGGHCPRGEGAYLPVHHVKYGSRQVNKSRHQAPTTFILCDIETVEGSSGYVMLLGSRRLPGW